MVGGRGGVLQMMKVDDLGGGPKKAILWWRNMWTAPNNMTTTANTTTAVQSPGIVPRELDGDSLWMVYPRIGDEESNRDYYYIEVYYQQIRSLK